jgi:hypothetical protein
VDLALTVLALVVGCALGRAGPTARTPRSRAAWSSPAPATGWRRAQRPDHVVRHGRGHPPQTAGVRDCLAGLPGAEIGTVPAADAAGDRTKPVRVPGDGTADAEAFEQRARLPSCGRFDVGHGRLPADAAECLQRAVGSPQGAELAVSRLTDEGDPVVGYLRALPGTDRIEAFTDTTRDDSHEPRGGPGRRAAGSTRRPGTRRTAPPGDATGPSWPPSRGPARRSACRRWRQRRLPRGRDARMCGGGAARPGHVPLPGPRLAPAYGWSRASLLLSGSCSSASSGTALTP